MQNTGHWTRANNFAEYLRSLRNEHEEGTPTYEKLDDALAEFMTVAENVDRILTQVEANTLKPGKTIVTRFGGEWEVIGPEDTQGWVKARRKDDGHEREIHRSDIAEIRPA